MPEYRLIDNRRKGADVAREMSVKLESFHQHLLQTLAQTIVDLSPVDTGTYMDGHSMHVGRQNKPRTESSAGKPRNQSHSKYAGEASSRLLADIAATKAGDEVFVSNSAVHSVAVEYGGHNWKRGPYAVYRTARARVSVIAAEAAKRAGGGI